MRLSVDVGGTFTDVVLEFDDGSGLLDSIKVLTTAAAPELGVLEGVESVVAGAGVAMGDIDMVIHGTTLATNALIERRGARTAFVTTAGFRDVVETRTESRFDQYDLNLVLPVPLIERQHRYDLEERMSAPGEVLLPLNEAAAVALASSLADQGYEAVAVGFLHSYRNPAHERRFREILAQAAPGITISISSDVSPQMRELERFNTVCANAYVQPVMAGYLYRLGDELSTRGLDCEVYMIHSGGGLMSLQSAARLPVRLVESGPAGGAIFAADLAARHGLDRVLGYDMGGTTAKICLINDYTPRTAKTFEVARSTRFAKGSGMSISIPVIEMVEIGAGGGSIATVDRLQQIRVGPESAGAQPGPASYQLGGRAATVSDADLVLGRLAPETFGANQISLDVSAALQAVATDVGSPLSLTPREAAVGISEVVEENMANAARVHAVENGMDLDGFTMVAFGGAAPLHAGRLCDKLGIDRLLIPPGAGVGSAIGFLRAAFAYEAVRSYYVDLRDFAPSALNEMLAELRREAESFVREGTAGEPEIERFVYMRYAGQGWEIPVELGSEPFDSQGGELLTVSFTKAYEEFFGRAIEGLAVEAVSWSVRAVVARPQAVAVEPQPLGSEAQPAQRRTMHDPITGRAVSAALLVREDITAGQWLRGPALIVEDQTTTVLAATHRAVMLADGCLLVEAADPVDEQPSRLPSGVAAR